MTGASREGRNVNEGRWRRLLWQFARFLVVGLLSFAFDYGLFFVLFHFFGVSTSVESRSRSLCRLAVQLLPHAQFVSKPQPAPQIAVQFRRHVGLKDRRPGLNQLILFLTVAGLGASPLIGKLVATAVVLVYNFISRKLLIERTRGARPAAVPNDGSGTLETGGSST